MSSVPINNKCSQCSRSSRPRPRHLALASAHQAWPPRRTARCPELRISSPFIFFPASSSTAGPRPVHQKGSMCGKEEQAFPRPRRAEDGYGLQSTEMSLHSHFLGFPTKGKKALQSQRVKALQGRVVGLFFIIFFAGVAGGGGRGGTIFASVHPPDSPLSRAASCILHTHSDRRRHQASAPRLQQSTAHSDKSSPPPNTFFPNPHKTL